MQSSLRFGEFELFPARFELCRAGRTLQLERKPMELLILLTAEQDRVVTRTEIARHLWGTDVFVDTEHGINTAVRKLRQALKDDPEKPRYIQTVPKLGYRFLAPVSRHSEPAALPTTPTPPIPPSAPVPASPAPQIRSRLPMLVAASSLTLLCILAVIAASARSRSRTSTPELQYEQLTDLTDSAVAPAISADGRTLAFIRDDAAFGATGPIYAKALPNGDNRLITDDQRPKYGLTFSPDGLRIAYTVFGKNALETYTVSIFGGEPTLLMRNAAGLSWLSTDRLLFSQVRSGIHLGVVTGTPGNNATHDVYFPAHQRGMAHYSSASPDHRWILVTEMDSKGDWAPCRLVALTGRPEARVVGPTAPCTSAAWAPDGQWMYFTASVAGQSHLWRQPFPAGSAQQITSGAAEEDGLAADATGNALITSIGKTQSALWIHDSKGERPLSSEGEVLNGYSPPVFRQQDTALYYLLRRRAGPPGAELRRVDCLSGKVDVIVPGVSILDYDVSRDGTQVVFSTAAPVEGELWLAPTDHSRPPTPLGVQGASYPHFGPAGNILFQRVSGSFNYLEGLHGPGSAPSKVVPFPINEFQGVSPQSHWAMAVISESPGSTHPTTVFIPLDGGQPRTICAMYCAPRWADDDKTVSIPIDSTPREDVGRQLLLDIGPHERLPSIPAFDDTGFPVLAGGPRLKRLPRANLVAGTDPDHYAFVKTTVQRNLYRLRLK